MKASYIHKASGKPSAIIRVEFVIDSEDVEVGVAWAAYYAGSLGRVTSRAAVEGALKDQLRNMGDQHKQSCDFWDSWYQCEASSIEDIDHTLTIEDCREPIRRKARELFPEFYTDQK